MRANYSHKKIVIYEDTLVILGYTPLQKLFYSLKIVGLIFIMVILVFKNILHPLFIPALFIPAIFTFWNFLKLPANFFHIKMSKTSDGIQINKTFFPYKDLLFLSIREKDNYSMIRLEAKRRHILFANEKILLMGLDGFESALSHAYQLRDFIGRDLRINQITMGAAATTLWRGYTNSKDK